MLQEDQLDLGANLMTVTLARSRAIDFTHDIESAKRYLYVRSDSYSSNQILAMINTEVWVVTVTFLVMALTLAVVANMTTGVGENS